MLTTYVNLPANPDTDLLDVEFADIELARFSVLPYTTLCISYADLGTAGGSWVADLQWSNNSVDWFAFATPVQIGPGAGPNYVTPIDISDCAFVRLVVTTGEGSSTLIRVAVCAKGSSTIQTFANLPANSDWDLLKIENELDIGRQLIFPCLPFSKASVHVIALETTFSVNTQIAIEVSNNNVDWLDPWGYVFTNAGPFYISNIDVSTFAFLRCRASAFSGGRPNTYRLAVCMKSTS